MSIINASGAALASNGKRTLSELCAFLKNPTLRDAQTYWDRRIWFSLAILVLLDASLTIPITWLLSGYDSFIENALSRDVPTYTGFEDETFIEAILLGVVLAPLLEEPMFRGWLTGKLKHLVIGGLWIAWLFAVSFVLLFNENETVDAVIAISMLLLLALSVLIYVVFRRDHSLSPLFAQHFPKLFWISIISFGLLHVANYEYDNYWLVIPYVIPQLTAGTLWAFARVNYGLKASIMLHAISNLWITCLYYLVAI